MLSWKILKSKASIGAFLSHFPPKYYIFLVSLGHCRVVIWIHHWRGGSNSRYAQTAGDLGFAMQFNAETLWHSSANLGSDSPQSNSGYDLSLTPLSINIDYNNFVFNSVSH